MIITIRVIEERNLVADDIENFSLKLDHENKAVLVYHKGELLGTYAEVCGIDNDEFLEKVVKEK